MLQGAPDEIAATARPYGPDSRDDLVRTDSSQPKCQRVTGVQATTLALLTIAAWAEPLAGDAWRVASGQPKLSPDRSWSGSREC